VRLLRNPDNRGFAAANNQALKLATGRYVLLFNSDTLVRPGALGELVRFMDSHPQAGYCGPRLVNGDGSHQSSARRFPTPYSTAWAVLGKASRCPESRHSLDLHAQHGDRATFRADWLTGAALLVRQEALQAVGLLDEGYFMYFEETQWCHRLSQAGWEGWFVGSAEILHYGGRSVDAKSATEPFFGNHPQYWVASRRRYTRQMHGLSGVLLSETLDIGLHSLIWLRHRWRHEAASRQKARRAAQRLRTLLHLF